jgi:hypothetical protein
MHITVHYEMLTYDGASQNNAKIGIGRIYDRWTGVFPYWSDNFTCVQVNR